MSCLKKGQRLRIFWEKEGKYYNGVISEIKDNGQKCKIRYDDGDIIWEKMKKITYQLECERTKLCDNRHKHTGKCNKNLQEKHLKRKREEEEEDDSVEEKEISKKVKKSKRDETVFQERLSSLENGMSALQEKMKSTEEQINNLNINLKMETKRSDNGLALVQDKMNFIVNQISMLTTLVNSLQHRCNHGLIGHNSIPSSSSFF